MGGLCRGGATIGAFGDSLNALPLGVARDSFSWLSASRGMRRAHAPAATRAHAQGGGCPLLLLRRPLPTCSEISHRRKAGEPVRYFPRSTSGIGYTRPPR
jgi:hypothetical protein